VTTSANVELLRGFGDALNAHDIEAMLAYCDPNIELHSGIGAIQGVYHGHDGVRRWHGDNQEVWGEEIRSEIEAVFDLGEHTLAFHVARGRGQRSGVEVAMPQAVVVSWRDGLITYIKGYRDREDTLRDLGVTEDELEPIAVTDSPNLELVRSIYAAWERGDFSSAAWAHTEIEWLVADGPSPGRWTGVAGMKEASRDTVSVWEGFRTKAHTFHEIDAERVLVLTEMGGRGKTSGVELAQVRPEGAMLWHVRDGKVTKLVAYWDRDRALADLGLAPDDAADRPD
jgi:ketosteroid isomerase-like protein